MDSNFFRRYLGLHFMNPLTGTLLLLLTLVGCNPKIDEINTIMITSLSSTSGPPAGGGSITISGAGFTFIEGVTFDSLACTGITVVSTSTITCTIPAHPVGAAVVTVFGKGGRKATSQYTYIQDAPSIRTFLPTSGALAGNTLITIYGEGFITGTTVTMNGSVCTSPTIVSSTEMNCRTPANADGSYNIIATNPNGLTSTSTTTFRYRPAPTLTSISPLYGTNAGGTTITLTGTNFFSGATVTIGGIPCFSPTVISSTSMTCSTPLLSVGLHSVTVTNNDSQTSGAFSSFESLVVPAVTSVTPSSGAAAGGSVTIRGSNFLTGADIEIGGTTVAATFVSSTVLTVTLPAKTVGTYDLKVKNPNSNTATEASVIFPAGYTYQDPPNPTSVSPLTGSLAGGETITISGTGFLTGATVLVGGSSCTNVNVLSLTSLTCKAPAHAAGVVSVRVTNSDSQTITLANAYTYRGAPTITSISPDGGPTTGGGTLVITGTQFFSDATVKVGGNVCTSVVVTPQTSISCTVPAGTTGAANVVVTHLDGQTATLSGGFTYRGPPVISSVTPSGGNPSGGTVVTIAGTGFSLGVGVTVGGVACTVTASSATSITCQTGAHAAGIVDVIVTNNDAQSVTGTGAFTYQAAPTITTVTPIIGPEAAGTAITIDGTGFISGATVSVGGSPCTSVVTTSTQITCNTPAHTPGVVAIIVTNPDNQTATRNSAFTYQAAPTITSVSPTGGDAARPADLDITITGTGFLAGATAYLGSSPSDACDTTTVNSATSITCRVLAAPGGATRTSGAKTVRVINTDLQVGPLASGFSFLDAPTISTVSPNGGLPSTQTNITLTGTNFFAGAVVTVGGSACTNVVVVNSTTITCRTPSLPAGPAVDVVVTNVDAQVATSVGAYTYQPAPTISYATPTMGPTLTSTNVTITGTGFLPGARVFIGTNECLPVTVNSSTSISCTTPGSPTSGAASIVVTNTDQQTVTQTTGFIFLPPVTVTGVTPQTGPLGGLNTVTITGTQFYAGATVLIGGNPCTNVNVVSTTSITCDIPASLFVSATSVNVSVTSSGQTGTLTNGYTYRPAPTVSSVSPSAGALAGGTLLTVTGTDFVAGIKVYVDGVACSSLTYISDTSVTCLTPARTAGTYAVSVENIDTQTASLGGVFTYRAAPTVTGVTPNVGALGGGTAITITGTGFISPATVSFSSGGTCTSVTVVSPTSITCTTPAKTAGVYSLSVINPESQSGTLNNAYTYRAAPSITSISPTGGAIAGGTTLTITGSGFITGATVQLGGVTCTSPTVVTSTSMTCITGNNGSAAVVDTVVTNADTQTGTLSSSFTYRAAPTVASLSVSAGALAGGTNLTITGTGYLAGAVVRIGGTACTSVVVSSATSITCTTVAKTSGTYDLTVTNSDNQVGTLTNGYTYRAAPTITSLSPASGALAGSTSVTISGTGFVATATVSLGGSSCGVTALTATSITCTTTSHAAGQVNVVVTNPEGQSATLNNGFTYLGAPTVGSVSANSGPQAGSTLVTITGTNFYAGATVLFDASACTSVNVVSSTTITCSTPSHAAGAVRVSVINADTQSGYLDAAYTYTAVAVLSFTVGATSPTPPNPDNYGSTTTNITHTFTIKNTGEGTSSSISVARTGANPAAWFVGTDNCSGATLAQNATCTIQLTFFGSVLPTGSYSANLTATAATGGTATNAVLGSVP